MASKGALAGQVKELMSTHIVSLHAGATVHEALQMMVENRVSALPVVDQDNHCVGFISTTDLLELTYDIDDDVVHTDPLNPSERRRLVEKLGSAVGNEPVSSYMSEQVVTANESQSLKSAARLMLKNQVHHLPIVNNEEQLIGILSTTDILAAFADED
jgi:CBS domain-containing protein